MKPSFLILGLLFAVASSVPLLYLGCGVQNPNEPNWGYPTTTATPLPPPSLPATVFNNASSVALWSVSTNMSATAANIVFNPNYTACSATTGAMEVTLGFTAINQADYVWDTVSPVVDLSGKNISAILSIGSGCTSSLSYDFYAKLFVEQGSAPGSGTANYQLWGNYASFQCNGTSSNCVTLTLAMPASGMGAGSIDPTQIQYLGIQIGSGGGGYGVAVADVKSWTYQ